MKWLNGIYNIISRFKKYECDCCWEERKIHKCPTKNCNYKMCDHCIFIYKKQECPSCKQMRFREKYKKCEKIEEEYMSLYIDIATGLVIAEDGRILDINIADLIIYD
jgi:hypothetical protein